MKTNPDEQKCLDLSKIEEAKQEAFHEAYEKKAQECRDKGFREPNTTDYGMGYGDGYAAATRWHSTADGLPTEEGEYLVTKHGGEVCLRWLNVSDPDYCKAYFLAWMPLPAPFTEGETK